MNGVIYPEITTTASAAKGGYLSASMASSILTFLNSAKRPKYRSVDKHVVANTSGHNASGHQVIVNDFTQLSGYNLLGVHGGAVNGSNLGFDGGYSLSQTRIVALTTPVTATWPDYNNTNYDVYWQLLYSRV